MLSTCCHPRADGTLTQVRCATKKAGGSTKNTKGSHAQRLGVKVFHGAPCKAGSIIIRQRGNKWRPGENVAQGKDDTLYSLFEGRVHFYAAGSPERTHVKVIPQAELPPPVLRAPRR